MTALAILGAIVLALTAAILRVAGRVLADEGHATTGRRLGLLAAVFAALAIIGAATVALAHDPYGHWVAPDNPGLSCCHGQDCRPSRAYMGDDGLWRAWDGRVWLTVPAGRVLPTDYAGDGRSHLCSRAGHVLCFTPGQPRG